MDKRQLIEDIRKYNITAQTRFLAQFDETALQQYLQHLQAAEQKRMRSMRSMRSIAPQNDMRMTG